MDPASVGQVQLDVTRVCMGHKASMSIVWPFGVVDIVTFINATNPQPTCAIVEAYSGLIWHMDARVCLHPAFLRNALQQHVWLD